MRRPILNTDILVIILSFLADSTPTISAMMQSCRFFYHEGPKVILKYGLSFFPDWDEEIPLMLRFILAEGGIRCRYIGGFFFHLIDPDPSDDSEDSDDSDEPDAVDIDSDVADFLIAFFREHSFPKAEWLILEPAEELLMLLPELLPAFTALPNVKYLQLYGCGRIACNIPRNMTKLVSVHLEYDLNEERTRRPMLDIHPLIILTSSRNTLQWVFLADSETYLPVAYYPAPFSKVISLKMNGPHPPILAPFAHAFPNLLELALLDKKVFFGNVMPEGPSIPEGGRRDVELVRSWKLKQAMGPLRDLYLGGLACEIEHVQTFMAEESTYEALRELVSYARPSNNLIVQTSLPGMLDDAKGLPSMLRSAGGRLEEFGTFLRLQPDENDMDMEAGLVSVFRCLWPTPRTNEVSPQALLRTALLGHPLHTVRLLIVCHDIPAHHDVESDRRSILPTCPVEEYMATVDLGVLARSFLDSIATVNLAVVAMLGHRTRNSDDARATRVEGSIVVERKYSERQNAAES
ncbi:hypothetical protein GSI_06318 [Ganoderma sinense ZZ0214-1]|uniref:F-box domain-containing protein n=1 Tax=Ganoderma sinense ZZ0214-1 TaxID=1077348 RepID=A0A2G8SCW4_9APHY|nr:hypothetical protein GSI_06318 [Ganoderma sinense ZZ0214-1]